MTRVDITLGLLAIMGSIMIVALVGFGENERMDKAMVGFNKRSVETGAQLFHQYCEGCHGPNASGLNCPPLNEFSGLHGGDLGPGVAWRLEEQHWDRGDVYGYVYSTISAGRTASTRPDRYRGLDPNAMQMPAWSQQYNGPLRPDQIKDLTNYVLNFREYFPEASEPDAHVNACQMVVDNLDKPGVPLPSVPGYTSECYEVLCTAKMRESDPEFDPPPDMAEPKPDDPKYTENPDQLAKDQTEYRRNRAEWNAYWARCESLGGALPPPTPAPTATAAEDTAGAADEGAAGTADGDLTGTPEAADAEQTGTPGTETAGTPEAESTGSSGVSATGTPGAARTGTPAATATRAGG